MSAAELKEWGLRWMDEAKLTPAEVIERVMRNEPDPKTNQPYTSRQIDAARALLPYRHAKLISTTIKGTMAVANAGTLSEQQAKAVAALDLLAGLTSEASGIEAAAGGDADTSRAD